MIKTLQVMNVKHCMNVMIVTRLLHRTLDTPSINAAQRIEKHTSVPIVERLLQRKLHALTISIQFIWERGTRVTFVKKNSSSGQI